MQENNHGLYLVDGQVTQEPDAASDLLEQAIRFLAHQLTVSDSQVYCSVEMAMRFSMSVSVPQGEKESTHVLPSEL